MADTPMNLASMRAIYANRDEPHLLEEKLASKNPFALFDIWFKNVAARQNLLYEEVNAVCVSTVGLDMRPSSRMVLMKEYDTEGFSFFTHRTSRKGCQLGQNPNASMLFYWPPVHRQIRVEGVIRELPEEAALAYWKSRPLASRIGSKSSQQSAVTTRTELWARKKELEELVKTEGEIAVTKPEAWLNPIIFLTGFFRIGFKLYPRYFEFWQGQSDRLHDRIIFDSENKIGSDVGDGWHMYRIAP